MARSRVVTGTCHLCGTVGPLSFEHVPPRAAFNNRPVVAYGFDEAIKAGPERPRKGRIHQRGAGAYTLCGKCNNDTGRWYGGFFADWARFGVHVQLQTKGQPCRVEVHNLAALPIIKQIITMLFSVNGERFQAAQPDLARFVLDREAHELDKKFRIFCYFLVGGNARAIGVCASFDIHKGRIVVMSEVSFPPFGYLMTFDSEAPDERLFEITHFAGYAYDERPCQMLRIPVLPTHTALPGDFRTREEIYRDRDANLRAAEEQS